MGKVQSRFQRTDSLPNVSEPNASSIEPTARHVSNTTLTVLSNNDYNYEPYLDNDIIHSDAEETVQRYSGLFNSTDDEHYIKDNSTDNRSNNNNNTDMNDSNEETMTDTSPKRPIIPWMAKLGNTSSSNHWTSVADSSKNYYSRFRHSLAKRKKGDKRREMAPTISDLSKASYIPVTFDGSEIREPLLRSPSPRTSESFMTFVSSLAQKRRDQRNKTRMSFGSGTSGSSESSELNAEGLYQIHVNPDVPLKMSDTLDIDSARVAHLLYHYVLRGDYIAPIKNPHKILDNDQEKCMANTFPKSTVIGCGITNYMENTCTELPNNCEYMPYNFDGPMPFPKNYFDYVHQRSVSTFLTSSAWNDLLSQLYRILKPGGYIELVERDMLPSNVGPCTAQLTEQVGQVMRERGMAVDMPRRLGDLLELHGFEEVHKVDIDVPIGAWGGVHGHLMGWLTSSTISMARHALVHGILWQLTGGGTPMAILDDHVKDSVFDKTPDELREMSRSGGTWTENEFNAMAQTVRNELSVNHTYATIHVYWARKPKKQTRI
ncbi:hypothetical protein BDF19DRAFT_433238 [Syncephalis fuscata]|nr:hypothetical protein BDF19DRAFT_433238 [Syncephalis fuscata]